MPAAVNNSPANMALIVFFIALSYGLVVSDAFFFKCMRLYNVHCGWISSPALSLRTTSMSSSSLPSL